jgi:transposase-like protein
MDDPNLANLAPYFADPEAAAELLEGIRWPNGTVCPHCGEHDRVPYRLKGKAKRRLWKCAACRKQFTVTVGTIFESSHIPLNKWLLAFYLLCSSKKGMSAHQLHRSIGVTYKTAWFMFHRIRHAMDQSPFQDRLSGIVEIDETFVGGKARNMHKADRQRKGMSKGGGSVDKAIVLGMVERGGSVRTEVVPNTTKDTLQTRVAEAVEPDSTVYTDQWRGYNGLGADYSHETVDHSSGEYVRDAVTTNGIEGYFANFKRGLIGVYHHVSAEHLHRYLSEFDFRYNTKDMTDGARTMLALQKSEGKRLRYSSCSDPT